MLKEVGEYKLLKMFFYAANILHSHIYQQRGGKGKASYHQPRQEISLGWQILLGT